MLIAHRWFGLIVALAVVITGLTGAVIPYQDHIRSLVAGEVWDVSPPVPGAPVLSGLELKRIVEEETGGAVSFIQLVPDADHASSVFVSAQTGEPPLPFQQYFLDPYTGDIRARVKFAELSDGPINIAPFLVSVHYSLAAGQTGRLILGVVALAWLLLSIAGLVLTFSRRRSPSFWRHWGRAWRLRRRGAHKVRLCDFHRATGLWLAPLTFVFTWSAVAFNLDAVHEPVQRMLGAQGLYEPVDNPAPDAGQAMPPERAEEVGARLMQAQADQRGFTVRGPEALSFRPYANVIGYYARTSLDGPTETGSTAVWFDQASGRLIEFRQQFGETSADAFDKSLRLLHTGEMFGEGYKLVISLFGLIVAATALAGVFLWLRNSRRSAPSPMGED
ncbi:PepSY-associated TM helix domain-containing protein [Aurantiacibacter flavus]|uniref:PepSY-associated TM helix domain-containing protein n=1 Tax=Aurantiacibacter flavus TaxID=3145232 RepID=A0ABV0D020_9SPHN